MLVTVFPAAFIYSSVRPGEYSLSVKLALGPGPFIVAAFRAIPGSFSMGNTFFKRTAIVSDYSAWQLEYN